MTQWIVLQLNDMVVDIREGFQGVWADKLFEDKEQ